MASLPARQPSQHRRSSPEQTSTPRTQSHASTSPTRTRNEDSLSLLADDTEADNTSSYQQDQTSSPQPNPPATTTADDSNINKCWICFSDSTEDTPETSPWRSPCPCALVAHEECLLDWIADTEAPNNRRSNRGLTAPRIECPQCKSEIKLARPRNLVVEAVRGLERLGSQAVLPGAVAVGLRILVQASMASGISSIYAVFGAEDGFRILRPLLFNHGRSLLDVASEGNIGEALLAYVSDSFARWRLMIGLPLITPMIVLSRTTLADPILPVLPVIFFATQAYTGHDTAEFAHWPPSASFAFAVLPYIRSTYNIYYKKVWAPKERQWLKEIQPRVNQGAGNEGAAGADGAAGGNEEQDLGGIGAREDDENIFEVRIDGGIWEDWEEDGDFEDAEGEQQAQRPADDNAAPAPQIPMPQQQDEQAEPAPAAQPQQQEQQQPNPQPQPAVADRRLSFSPTAIAETFLGAIFFPAIAGLSGELLKFALPRSWTTPQHAPSSLFRSGGRMPAKGLLQEKWGRSLVGGCLFVVLKDAVMLYVRWKMAVMHRRRRVLDYKEGVGKGRRVGRV
ncbi:hypothetical protein LTR37_008792 [Vermiconidia calcicola]|uniref:Uncharacterized protein n=1 Tax=Vermiconidia calcicola TaxID=1690605 RepID=A0ACC3N9L4_9PEZI|nr:hypothetical protein LTR37_008792 [Vermiconidia calcicola]